MLEIRALFWDALEIYKTSGPRNLLERSFSFLTRVIAIKILTILGKIFSILLPTKRTLVLFSNPSKGYGGNSRPVFEWFLENKDDIDARWIAENEDVYQKLTEKGIPVVKSNSLRGVYLTSIANIVATTAKYPYAGSPDHIIFLKHGNTSKFGQSYYRNKKNSQYTRERRNESNYILSTSQFDIEQDLKRVDRGRRKFVVTGFPRNDQLVNPSEETKNRWKKYRRDQFPSDIEKIILYAPTYRHPDRWSESVQLFPFEDFEIDLLSNFLAEHNILLLLRLHPGDEKRLQRDSDHTTQLKSDMESLTTKRNIQYISNETYNEVNDFLPYVDILVTDYTSIYHDFLLLDKPMLFVPYDYSEFNEKVGFIYDYKETLPGPEIESLDQFTSEVNNIIEGQDSHKYQREELRSKVHYYQDDQSTKRVGEMIYNIIKKE